MNSDQFTTIVSTPGLDFGDTTETTTYQCSRCEKSYIRLDHIKRHYRSHDNERPYRCNLCSKTFNRKDLLDRHSTVHELGRSTSATHSKRRNRAAKACRRCIAAKTKCSDGRPCKRCLDRGEVCSVDIGTKLPALSHPNATLAESAEHGLEKSAPSSLGVEQHREQPEPSSTRQIVGPPDQPTVDGTDPRYVVALQPSRTVGDNGQNLSAGMGQPGETMQTGQNRNVSNVNEVSYPFDHTSLQTDFLLNFDDDSLFAMDLDWNSLIEPAFTPDRQIQLNENLPPSIQQTDCNCPRTLTTRAWSGHQAFKRSPWLWDPDPRDSAFVEEAPQFSEAEEQLLLPRVILDKDSAASRPFLPPCGNSARDAILLLVQNNSGPNLTVKSFPSAKTLNRLLIAFIARETSDVCPFIHVPSMIPDKCRIELLSAMIAAGATTTGIRQIWKLGLALQERTRLAIFRALDHDNSVVRTLEIVQASLLWIEAGLWSGFRRKMEVAESAANNVPTMLRRAGAFVAGFYEPELLPNLNDDGEFLRMKWLKWAELESFKRSVFRALIDDVQSSVAYMRSPCFSSTEISFILPAARGLWNAASPQEWKTLLLARRRVFEADPLTLKDIIQDPWKLKSCQERYDCELSAYAALHGLWPQTASYLDSRALHRASRSAANSGSGSLWLEGQRQELYKKLLDIREVMRCIKVSTAEAYVICELFMMSLYLSPIDAQKFAGRCGVEEARAITPTLQAWSETDEQRYAIWHAGQVLRAAQSMNSRHVHGFHAIAVYQSCITLVLPLLLSDARLSSSRNERELVDAGDNSTTTASALLQRPTYITSSRQQSDPVILNGEEGLLTKSYLLTGQGSPALVLEDEVRLISNAEVIPTAMAKIFGKNHSSNGEALPPFLEKLIVLLTDLIKAI